MREIHRLADQGDDKARLAIDMFCHRLKKYLGAYYAELGTIDAVVFTGGIGENDAEVRERTCANLERLGICVDARANASPERGERSIGTAESAVKVLVIPTNEELEIAQETLEALPGV